ALRYEVAVAERERERLLYEDVLARVNRGQRDFGVERGRHADRDRFNARVLQEPAPVRVATLDAVSIGDRVQARRVQVRERERLDARHTAKRREVARLRHAPATHEAYAN